MVKAVIVKFTQSHIYYAKAPMEMESSLGALLIYNKKMQSISTVPAKCNKLVSQSEGV